MEPKKQLQNEIVDKKAFYIKYNLFKDGSPVIDGFSSKEEREKAIIEKRKQGYNPIKIASTEEAIRFHIGIK